MLGSQTEPKAVAYDLSWSTKRLEKMYTKRYRRTEFPKTNCRDMGLSVIRWIVFYARCGISMNAGHFCLNNDNAISIRKMKASLD